MLKIIRPKEQVKLQWLQDPSEINGDNLNNIRHKASRQAGKRDYLKEKVDKLAMNSKHKNIREL
jgi:hypothetical protein